MQHAAPTLFINVFRHWETQATKDADGKAVKKSFTVDMPYERAVIKNREEAVRHAEEFSDFYVYTLTDVGIIDLTPDFSEGFHEKRDFDAAVDRKIDDMKAERFKREEA